jgi:hypothetical protein
MPPLNYISHRHGVLDKISVVQNRCTLVHDQVQQVKQLLKNCLPNEVEVWEFCDLIKSVTPVKRNCAFVVRDDVQVHNSACVFCRLGNHPLQPRKKRMSALLPCSPCLKAQVRPQELHKFVEVTIEENSCSQ